MAYTGELIAVATVLCWTVSIQLFEVASKRAGASEINFLKMICAIILYAALLFWKHGYIIPLDFPAHAWFYLTLSGIVGFFIGDILLFKALIEIGSRVTMVIFSLSAPTAALLGWIFLNETYLLHQWAGMIVTITGVSLVILERHQKVSDSSNLKNINISMKGVLFGFGGMIGQASGYILSKIGMQIDGGGYLDAFAASQIRVTGSIICFLIFFTITGKWKSFQLALSDKKAIFFTTIGSVFGPFLGVSLSLLILHYLTTGVASTFLSLVPVFIIPFSIFIHKEHVSIRAVAGTLIAVSGIYLLMS
ncbi:DMT family transporter [bacterium]|nr:DMT family transporter [bacterium]